MDKPPPYSPPGAPPAQPGFVTTQPGISAQPGYPQQAYPPEIHFHPPPHVQDTVIITNAPMMITSLGPCSQVVTCPHCHHTIPTRVQTEPSTKTHLFALLMCLFGCWPCCVLPYCMDSCQSQSHYCIHCGAFLGTYDN